MPRARKGTQPVQAAPGGDYGQRQQSEQAQQQVPLPDRRAGFEAALAGAQGMQPSGGLTGPTQRPGEPLSAGLSVGPGAGPSPQQLPKRGNGIDPNLAPALRMLPTLEAHASRPGATPAFRQFVFQLRSMLPPGMSPADI